MKQVPLFQFIKRLAEEGVNVVGCEIKNINNASANYEFLQLVKNNVQVKYGVERNLIGHMTKDLKVIKISFDERPRLKIISNRSITIHYLEMITRW